MKDLLVPIDQAGRVVLPKNVREELAIKPGDVLRVAITGSTVTLTPNREAAGLRRKGRALVFSTADQKFLAADAVDDLLHEQREERSQRSAGKLSSTKG